ncbi:MAG: DUF1353 domain-containing protein [Myxococcales bacterium FL481]|nr:MAG: DUF1353 domain-containing protein [Myxococcales bacterium FL481]
MKTISYSRLHRYKYRLERYFRIWTDLRPANTAFSPGQWVVLDREGALHFQMGYAWDGASGPAVDTKSWMRASLVHDGLYQLMRTGSLPQSYREPADRLMRQLCIEDGMPRVRAWWSYWAVRAAGGLVNRAARDPKMLTAP